MDEVTFLLLAGCDGRLVSEAPGYLKCAADIGILEKDSIAKAYHGVEEIAKEFKDKATIDNIKEIIKSLEERAKKDEKFCFSPNSLVALRAEVADMARVEQFANDFCKNYTVGYRVYEGSRNTPE